ncbi:integrase core domain-containing protein [Bosea sp. PAMC 26642]|uniref:integrase core domain-containing protein n=1 Tax=Bosea sp. (strain PAMC 26642) TaxID=1792307 RepID=UPI000770193F|nr:hypothetical protein AXW83_14950 [Bosea sp. PAMC 26642]
MQKRIESCKGRLGDELLNETPFSFLAQARTAWANSRTDDSTARPYSQLGCQTPRPSPRLPNRLQKRLVRLSAE